MSSTVFFIIFSTIAAINIADPMIKLSNIVKNTKKGEYDSIPPLEGGCKEVQSVYNTFAKLNKIVKISNTSFFSGKLTLAHHFVSDALVLYRKINDRKAIGVTCNNLANTLFAMQFEHFDDGNCCDSMPECYVKQALALYDEAMSYSHEDFNGAEGDLKVDYAIQLSDRLFNRGLYFLFIDGYDCAPEDSRQRGYNDITFSRNLHDDIRDYLLEKKLLFAKSSSYFSRLFRRINCLAAFYDDVGLREIWDARVLLDEAKQLVEAATEVSSTGSFCPLFQEVNHSGRQQQLESLEILLDLNSGEIQHAARTGMRMLVEDVYLMEDAFVRAAEALVHYMKERDRELSFSKRSIECTRNDLRTIVKSCRKKLLEIGKNTVFVLDISPSQWNTSSDGSNLLDGLNARCLWLYDNFCQADDQIGVVANTVNDTQPVEIGVKEDNEGRQRSFLDVATDISGPEHSTEETTSRASPRTSTCFPIGSQMLIDSHVSLQSNSYIVWITDGNLRYEERTISSLRDQIERLNQERCYQIHVVIVDLKRDSSHSNTSDIQTEEEDWRSAQESLLRQIGNVSKTSIYLSANSEDELTSVFDHLSAILSNNQSTSEFISYLTMEKF